jgi:DNA primase
MDVVDEVKSRLDPVEYIGRVVNLQRAGRNFRGLCPFHNERTPSFYVFPDRGTWRCFGACGEGGDIFTFVQKREGLQFRDALRELADLAGVQLSREATQKRSRREHLAAIMSAAVEYYQRCFREAGGQAAQDYVYQKRGITEAAVSAFRIGWAPDEWRSLHDYLLGRGYSEADAVAAGLLIEPESGGQPYDRFRGRIIIPIADERGVFVAMGGRALGDEEPKYLNSPQTELFDKGRTLFGLDLAGDAARESGSVVVVEGYMDVIGPWQAGFRNVVATMGTSLTEHHAKLLRRYTSRIVLAMDPDSAGMAAAERAGELLLGSPEQMGRAARHANAVSLGAGVELRVAQMPAGKDPDEVAREDPKAWTRTIEQARPFPEFLLMRLMGDGRPESPLEARRMVDRMRPILEAVTDPVERAMYVQRVARHLDIPETAIMDRIRRPMQRAPRPRDIAAEARRTPSPEDMLLALILRHPSLRLKVRGLPADLFSSGINRELFLRWVADEDLAMEGEDDPAAGHIQWLRGLRLPPYSDEEARKAAGQTIHAILKERLLQRQAALSEDVASLERELGANRVAELSEMAWRGALIPDDADRVAHMVIEDLELGLSLHRREEPRLA